MAKASLEYWHEMTKLVASRSHATRAKVGAVITKDERVIATGFNGQPSGMPNVCEDENGNTKPDTVHAECNAIAFAARHGISTEGSTMYVTLSPCRGCAALVVQAGIKRVVFGEAYRDTQGTDLLNQCNVEVIGPISK